VVRVGYRAGDEGWRCEFGRPGCQK
jgi:hypothetical protein